MSDPEQLQRLDSIARDAWAGDFGRTDPLSTGERLYVALAAGRMQELCPGDSIAYAVDRVGPEWMAHMLKEWRGSAQPSALTSKSEADHVAVLRQALAALKRGRPQIAGALVQQDQDDAIAAILKILR